MSYDQTTGLLLKDMIDERVQPGLGYPNKLDLQSYPVLCHILQNHTSGKCAMGQLQDLQEWKRWKPHHEESGNEGK